jgi:hypothetical protein
MLLLALVIVGLIVIGVGMWIGPSVGYVLAIGVPLVLGSYVLSRYATKKQKSRTN